MKSIAKAVLAGTFLSAIVGAPSHASGEPAAAPEGRAFGDGRVHVEKAFDFAGEQLARVASSTPVGSFPVFTDNRVAESTFGQWIKRTLPKPNFPDWRVGFFPGCLWLMYEFTGDRYWRDQAQARTTELTYVQNDNTSHDVGFMTLPSFGNALRLTGDPANVPVLLRGADSLASRFNPLVGATQSWSFGIPQSWTFPVIIDNMMNIEILFWSAAHGGDPKHYDMAVSHALRTRQDHFRPDGSTYHLVDYDPTTGQVIKKVTVQGFGNETTWARGQAWAIHGFTIAYRYTHDPRMLETAERAADYFIAHVATGDWVPNWDFQAPAQFKQKDTSAAAIAASGLIELASFERREHHAAWRFQTYKRSAERILSALYRQYRAEGTPNSGILLHGTGNYPASYNSNNSQEIDIALIYGDYYFLQALLRYEDLRDDRRER